MILNGDCVEVMAQLDPDSIDAIVTDPPYGLGFMGKDWDTAKQMSSVPPSNGKWPHGTLPGGKGQGAVAWDGPAYQHWTQRWATEARRVAKPGAYLLAFGGTRTVHRLTVALEDAGWIIRDTLCWIYASGFPKSKASLKPAWEPIVLARKPGPLRMLRIDDCRIGTTKDVPASGRWPANVVLTDPAFDGGWDGVVGGGERKAGTAVRRNGQEPGEHVYGLGSVGRHPVGAEDFGYGDTGTYSRFFIIPKASRRDREPDMPGELEEGAAADAGIYANLPDKRMDRPQQRLPRRNTHPTVKPTALMRHLIRLVTPEGGTVLDPFLGSGTTAKAAVLEGVDWVGIEREPEYVRIAEQRLVGLEPEHKQDGLGL